MDQRSSSSTAASQSLAADQLFDKNVRRFLGGRVKVNKGMQKMLREEPELFGLFNNGMALRKSIAATAG